MIKAEEIKETINSLEHYTGKWYNIKDIWIHLKDYYNDLQYTPYCKLCSGCGEDGCCSYMNCVTLAMDSNKGCTYNKTYKAELELRHEFYKACFYTQERTEEINDFVMEMFDIAWNKIMEN